MRLTANPRHEVSKTHLDVFKLVGRNKDDMGRLRHAGVERYSGFMQLYMPRRQGISYVDAKSK